MFKESVAAQSGKSNPSAQQQGNQLSDPNNHNDLNKPSSQIGGEASLMAAKNENTAKSAPSPNNSPTKSSPTKSKNKKKNDAKRRGANKRQQQSQAAEPTSKSDKTKQSTEPGHESLDRHHPQRPNPAPTSTPETTPSKLINNKHIQPKRPESMDMAALVNQRMTPVSPSVKAAENTIESVLKSTNHSLTGNDNDHQKSSSDTNSWHRRQREIRDLREQIKIRDGQLQNLSDRAKQQIDKTKELEASLVSTTQTCSQFEKLLQQELANRSKLEAENYALGQTVERLRHQISVQEKERSANNELIRVLNATLMERETEVSILKLKMTRMQTNTSVSMSQFNPPSSSSLVRADPCKTFTMTGRSNSEFTRNSTNRSTLMAEAISTRSSTSQLRHPDDRDAQIWANIPEELTPSKRPILLERNLPQLYEQCHNISGNLSSPMRNQSSTPIMRDRRYRTLPRSMKNPLQPDDSNDHGTHINDAFADEKDSRANLAKQPGLCLVTNLDDSNNTNTSGGNKSSTEASSNHDSDIKSKILETSSQPCVSTSEQSSSMSRQDKLQDSGNANTTTQAIADSNGTTSTRVEPSCSITLEKTEPPPNLTRKSPSTPVKLTFGLKKIFGKFKRSDSVSSESQSRSDLRTPPTTPTANAFQRGNTRSTLVGPPSTFRVQMSPLKAMDFQTDKPFADWDTNMLVDWLTMIGLSMYANQCKRWVECGAHIMNATPAEVDKGLGITNHLHRKKLRLAISELNGDCDKITKAAAKLDYLWVARWLDDIGVPQYKEAFINARVDGRVLNYLTVEDLISLGVKSVLHHSSIRCGIRVLRSINFNLQLLKRRATADEIEQMNSIRESMDTQVDDSSDKAQQVQASNDSDVPLWTCHRVMEWLRMIDFAEFAPNLRGSGVHGGLIIYEDAFNIDTISTLLSIPSSRTLLRRHLSTFFENLVGNELAQRKKQYKDSSSNAPLNPASEIKHHKKSSLWFAKLKSSKVGQDSMDEYLCPMYPVEPQIIKSPTRKSESGRIEGPSLPKIPESINV